MKTIFVTGVSGLLGTNVVNLLLENEFKVKGLVRHPHKYIGKKSKNLQLITGDLLDDFTGLLDNVDYVIHIAALTSQNSSDNSKYWEINSLATKRLFHSATISNVKKFIYISTANTIGYGTKNKLGMEINPIREPFSKAIYAQSKKSAEDFLLFNKQKTQVVIINPTFMLGAYDTKPSSGRIILMSLNKKLVFYPPGGKNFVHVEDVAKGIMKSIETGQDGEKYLLANENLSFHDFFIKVNKIVGQTPIMIPLPKYLLIFIGFLGDIITRLNIKTDLTSTNMRMLCVNNYYSNKKSRKKLHVDYQPIDKAISDAVTYFKHKKTCSSKT